MDVLSVIVWVILICGVAAICFWLATYAPANFQRPIRIVIFVVAAIFLVYLLGGLLMRMAPPFPGVIRPVYAAETCERRVWTVEPGKSGTGFKGVATDGCHTYEWVNVAGQAPGEGTVTFRTSRVLNGWEAGSTLPSMSGGAAQYCAYQAAHEANLAFMHYFQVPEGTEVRVAYSCK